MKLVEWTESQLALFSLGVLITVCGVAMLSLRPFEPSLQNLPSRSSVAPRRDAKTPDVDDDDETEDDKDDAVARRNSKKPLLASQTGEQDKVASSDADSAAHA